MSRKANAITPAEKHISDTVTFQPIKSTMESAVEAMNSKVLVNDTEDGISYAVSLAMPTKDGRTSVTVYDPEIAAKVALIQGYTTISDRTELIKCGFLASLTDEDLKKCGNFSSIADFGKAVFGWDRVSTLVYSRVGKFFVSKTDSEEGFEFWSYLPASYGKSHLQEILSAFDFDNDEVTVENVRKQVAKWLQNGTLTDNMSTSAIRKIMASLRASVEENGDRAYPLLKDGKKAKAKTTENDRESAGDETESAGSTDYIDVPVETKAALIMARRCIESVLKEDDPILMEIYEKLSKYMDGED